MEAVALDAFSEEVRANLFRSLDYEPSEWQDLGGFESFIFAHPVKQQILRVTHTSHRSQQDIEAEIEFIDHLSANGAAVAQPLPILNGARVVQFGDFVCSLFRLIPGRVVQQADWQPDLFHNWGKAIGEFHQLASVYQPKASSRFDWRSDANLDFRSRLPDQEEPIALIGERHFETLKSFSTEPSIYGLIHSDAHPGNFIFNDGKLTFIDFDDACYQWFAFDVATILFSAVLQPWVENSDFARESEARKFLGSFLEGYSQAFEVTDFLIENLALFLKLREHSLYAVIHSHMDVNNLEGWYPIKFMSGRRERLLSDEPYLNMTFSR